MDIFSVLGHIKCLSPLIKGRFMAAKFEPRLLFCFNTRIYHFVASLSNHQTTFDK